MRSETLRASRKAKRSIPARRTACNDFPGARPPRLRFGLVWRLFTNPKR